MIRRCHILLIIFICSVSSLLLYLNIENIDNDKINSFPSYLIINIISKPENFYQRKIIRETWLRLIEDKNSIKHFFTIGILSVNSTLKSMLDKENEKTSDMLFLSLVDTYRGLTNKVLNSFYIINKENNYEFLLKCDDDTFVNMPEFVNALKDLEHTYLYWGYFHGQAHVFSRGIWKESNWNLCDRYLPYALGGGYVLSRKLVSFISDNAAILRQFKSEDVSLGAWLGAIKTKKIHDLRFDTQAKSRGCQDNFLLKHKQSPQDMLFLYRSLVNTKKLCPYVQQTSLRPYSYNWSNLPSKCCSYVDISDSKVIYPSDF